MWEWIAQISWNLQPAIGMNLLAALLEFLAVYNQPASLLWIILLVVALVLVTLLVRNFTTLKERLYAVSFLHLAGAF